MMGRGVVATLHASLCDTKGGGSLLEIVVNFGVGIQSRGCMICGIMAVDMFDSQLLSTIMSLAFRCAFR